MKSHQKFWSLRKMLNISIVLDSSESNAIFIIRLFLLSGLLWTRHWKSPNLFSHSWNDNKNPNLLTRLWWGANEKNVCESMLQTIPYIKMQERNKNAI